MQSTPQERLFEVYESYRQAYDRRAIDWKECTTVAQAKSVAKNVDALETIYLQAAKQALETNSPSVELAYSAARQARADVDKAYQNAVALAARIRLVGNVVSKVGDLLKKATGK